MFSACSSDAAGQASSPESLPPDPEAAARAAFVAWSVARGVEYRELTTSTLDIQPERARVELRVAVRPARSEDWHRLRLDIPVPAGEDDEWLPPSVTALDRLARAELAAIDLTASRSIQDSTPTSPPNATAEPVPPATRPPMPPPPEGTVIYESDWTQGLDGWIGTPDWTARDGMLVNDGSRASRDPWIEAPVHVDPWQDMVVEFQAEVKAQGYASYGLIARAGSAGWFHFGVRWDPGVGEGGAHLAALGYNVRRDTRMEREELSATRRDLAPGPHAFRAEFIDGEATFYVDGQKVGELPEGDFQPGEYLGLWAELTPLEVHYFRVTLV